MPHDKKCNSDLFLKTTGAPWDPKLGVMGPRSRRRHHDAPLVSPLPDPRAVPPAAPLPEGAEVEVEAPRSPVGMPEEERGIGERDAPAEGIPRGGASSLTDAQIEA